MDVIEITRKLGAAIQQDERYINYAKAKLANDNDENLQKNIGEFNLIRMQLDNELSAEERNEDKIKELNEQLRMTYRQHHLQVWIRLFKCNHLTKSLWIIDSDSVKGIVHVAESIIKMGHAERIWNDSAPRSYISDHYSV